MKMSVFFIAILISMGLVAEAAKPDETLPILTVGTNVYHNARILRTTATEAFVKFDGGIIRAKLSDLPKEIQEQYPPADAPGPPPPKRSVRPQVLQRVPLDVAITNLETQIGNLEKAKEKLQTTSNEKDATSVPSESDGRVQADAKIRLAEIDRNITRLQAELERVQKVKESATPKPLSRVWGKFHPETAVRPKRTKKSKKD
jgi:hypothetical protein